MSSFPFNNLGKKLLILITVFNLFAASWYFLKDDLWLHTDIGRDFLLFQEIEDKKLVLIGARTGATGVYHGPFWYYFNMPVYLISNGNPVAQGFFWLSLIILSLYLGFKVAKTLFGEFPALVFIATTSNFFLYEANAFTHPAAAALLTVIYFYLFHKYLTLAKAKYLVITLIICGALVQLEIATGGAIMLLTILLSLAFILKSKNFKHLLAFLVLAVPFSTYLAFDLRHDFFQLKNLIKYVEEGQGYSEGFLKLLKNRAEYIWAIAVPIIRNAQINQIVIIITGAVLARLIYLGRDRKIYLLFLYLFLGFFAISMLSPYYLLRHHFIAFTPVAFLVFGQMLTTKPGKFLVPIFVLAIAFNFTQSVKYISDSAAFTGKHPESWKGMKNIAVDIFKGAPQEFGYFVNSPDKFGYSTKFAMIYGTKANRGKKAVYFEKRPVTYVINTPPPPNAPWYDENWWIRYGINIEKEPAKITEYPNGYRLYKYELSPQEVAVPFDKLQDLGIHFR